jgi:hypothetical protein
MPNKAKWTVLTYIAAHNNLDSFGRKSFNEIASVGSNPEVVLTALFDGAVGGSRYVIGEPGKASWSEPLGSFDSGDPDELIATAKLLFDSNPADHYGLILWSHGTGWLPDELEEVAEEARPGSQTNAAESRERAGTPGSRTLFRSTLRQILKPEKARERAILFDDGTGHSLDTLELARVTSEIAKAIGQPLDLLGMDACLMANVEVAYAVRESVGFMVASEELVPGHSWPYQDIFQNLQAQPEQSGADLATSIVNRYVSYYTANPPPAGDVTKAAFDLSKIDDLVSPINQVADEVISSPDTYGEILWSVQQATRDRETSEGKRKPNKFDFHLWDVGSVVEGLAASPQSSEEMKGKCQLALSSFAPGAGPILAAGHVGNWFDGTSGFSTYLMMPKKEPLSAAYSKLAYARDTHWYQMLQAYHKHYE